VLHHRPRLGRRLLRLSVTPLVRRGLGELLGTAMLLCAVVGSGIMASRLTSDVGLQLLINAVATAAALVAIILVFAPVSGAHLNPVVSLADRWFGGVTSPELGVAVTAQLAGACLGVVTANLMFGLPAVNVSTKVRTGGGIWLGEVVATFGLLLVVFALARTGRSHLAPFAVGAYIGAAYFFTSSTSFANPAVTVARTLSDSFAGIAPRSAPMFVAMELVGLVVAVGAVAVLFATPTRPDPAAADAGPPAGATDDEAVAP
jgi:glycerol uptake facilitator-like aquaporin